MKFVAHVLNLFCLEFAAWTACANAVTLLQGNLKILPLIGFALDLPILV